VKRALASVGLLSLLLFASCFRYEVVWAGMEFDDSGHRLKLSSEAGLCGCVTLGNRTNGPIHIHAKLDDVLTGQVVLQPGQRVTARFDWAGDTSDHAYVLEAFDAQGRRLRLRESVYVGEHSGWRSCQNPGCDWGTLMMRVATMGQHR
jgi:hypothetical protein